MIHLRVIRGCRECPFFRADGEWLDCVFDGKDSCCASIDGALRDSDLPECVKGDIAHDLSRVDEYTSNIEWFHPEPWRPSWCPLLANNVVFTAV